MKRKRPTELHNAAGRLKLESGIERAQVEELVNSSQGGFLLSKALCIAIDTLDASDPDVEKLIQIRDHIFPLYLLQESGMTEEVTSYAAIEALVETVEAMEEKLRGQDDS